MKIIRMIKNIFCIMLLSTVMTSACYADIQKTEPVSALDIEAAGIDLLRKGDFKKAFDQVHKNDNVKDTALRYFKLGILHYYMNHESKAITNLRLAADRNPSLTPFSYEYIGDIQSKLNDNQNAMNAYRVACNQSVPPKYRNHIIAKINIIYNRDSASLPPGVWLDEFRQWLRPQIKMPAESLTGKIDSLISSSAWSVLDTLLLAAVDNYREIGNVLQRMSSVNLPDSILKTSTLFTLSQSAYSNKEYSIAADFLKKVRSRKDFDTAVTLKKADYFEARLVYATQDYPKAVSLFKKYELKYGSEPELLMTIARAYRKIDNESEALKWYLKYVKLYPKNPKTPEILWLIAWRNELLFKYREAAVYYQKIYTNYKNTSRAEESHIRRALCYFKEERYDSSIAILENFCKKYPSSTYFQAAQFWKAKTFLAIDKTDTALVLFRNVSFVDPYEYYAIRSRQLMQLLGDTSEYSIDTSTDTAATLLWLDTISPESSKKELSANDSQALYRGLVLLMIGRPKESDFFLEQIEQSFPGNLALQFKLSLSYQRYDASMQAFRVARRLTWRIPQENRKNLPFLVYKLFYPNFYADAIKREGAHRNVDPFLICSVIRQESIFNPEIVSPAGAVGLMQIMPYTGKEVARKLEEPFTVDSLYQPFTNIKLGTAYLRELLDQFNDNLVLVLGGYNGGPHNAQKWFEHNKDEDFDLFIEDIEFTETRNYVKKVLSNYWTYRHLSTYPKYVYGSVMDTISVKKTKKNRAIQLADD